MGTCVQSTFSMCLCNQSLQFSFVLLNFCLDYCNFILFGNKIKFRLSKNANDEATSLCAIVLLFCVVCCFHSEREVYQNRTNRNCWKRAVELARCIGFKYNLCMRCAMRAYVWMKWRKVFSLSAQTFFDFRVSASHQKDSERLWAIMQNAIHQPLWSLIEFN